MRGSRGKHTQHTAAQRGRDRGKLQLKPATLQAALRTEAQFCLETFPGISPEAPRRWCLRHGLEQEAGPGAPRGPERWGRAD